jgi:hypothetical protein
VARTAVLGQDQEARQQLAKALNELHRAAGLISYRRVSKLTEGSDFPVSHESVRTTLAVQRGLPRWKTVEAVVSVLAAECSPPRDPIKEVTRFLPLWRALIQGESGGLKSAREFELSDGWGGDNGEFTPEAVAGVLVNPYTAIEIDPALVTPHEPLVSEEDWIKAGVRVIEEFGAEFFLRALLRTLKGDFVGAETGAPFGYQDPDRESADAYEAFSYCSGEILRRLTAEPNLLQRSIAAMRADQTLSADERAEMMRAELDLPLVREVMAVTPDSWNEISEEAHFVIFMYMVKQCRTMGRPGLPAAERFQITWRVSERAEG